MDKELPPKPILRCAGSPERRGIYGESAAFSSPSAGFVRTNQSLDAFDSGSEKVKCAPLQPSFPAAASPPSTGSDENGFEVSPSLRSEPYNSPRVAVGTTVNTRKVSANPVVVHSKNSGPPLNGTEPEHLPFSIPAQRRLPTTGQIAALRNGSPVSRHTPKSKFNDNKGFDKSYGSQKRIQRPKTEVKRELKVIENLSDAGSANSTGFGSPQQLDDLTRRSVKYGLGATLRSSHDARQIIMGDRCL